MRSFAYNTLQLLLVGQELSGCGKQLRPADGKELWRKPAVLQLFCLQLVACGIFPAWVTLAQSFHLFKCTLYDCSPEHSSTAKHTQHPPMLCSAMQDLLIRIVADPQGGCGPRYWAKAAAEDLAGRQAAEEMAALVAGGGDAGGARLEEGALLVVSEGVGGLQSGACARY